ncbi:uncharacterized protein Tco025E_08878 [Trypanosoma conorhini]|uniref:Uncharacterized protein n=1 Tax=Trypanosoma conorhini TaxID=83891 RepID=A0A422N3W4_9TRYP|nr:uncharacterized protein Tco025E_08878 [Trypanosoma conorhini]RNF00130.1 hypothetical protein Tco025E_08878 [Trypanosoma conorhini]
MPKVYDAQGTGFAVGNAQGTSKPLSCARGGFVARHQHLPPHPCRSPPWLLAARTDRTPPSPSHRSRVVPRCCSAVHLRYALPSLCSIFPTTRRPYGLKLATGGKAPAPGAAQAPPHQRRCGTATVAAGRGAQRRWATPRPAERGRRLPVCPSSAERAAFSRGTKVSREGNATEPKNHGGEGEKKEGRKSEGNEPKIHITPNVTLASTLAADDGIDNSV